MFDVDKEKVGMAFKPAQWCCVALLYIEETLDCLVCRRRSQSSCADKGGRWRTGVALVLVLHWCILREVSFVEKEKGGMAFKPAQWRCVALLYIEKTGLSRAG